MPDHRKQNSIALPVIVSATCIALVCIIAAVLLTFDGSGSDNNTSIIMALLGFVGSIVASIAYIIYKLEDTNIRVDDAKAKIEEVGETILNGGTENPVKRALHSRSGQIAVKQAVHEVLDERAPIKGEGVRDDD